MNEWEVIFYDGTSRRLLANNILDAAQMILVQNWNANIQEVESIGLVDNDVQLGVDETDAAIDRGEIEA